MTKPLRVIQSNNNGFVSKLGDLCYSGRKSFSDTNSQEVRPTLFILKKEDGTKDISIFESVFSGEVNEDGQYVFVCVTTPAVAYDVKTDVHLMSSNDSKNELIEEVLTVWDMGLYEPFFFYLICTNKVRNL